MAENAWAKSPTLPDGVKKDPHITRLNGCIDPCYWELTHVKKPPSGVEHGRFEFPYQSWVQIITTDAALSDNKKFVGYSVASRQKIGSAAPEEYLYYVIHKNQAISNNSAVRELLAVNFAVDCEVLEQLQDPTRKLMHTKIKSDCYLCVDYLNDEISDYDLKHRFNFIEEDVYLFHIIKEEIEATISLNFVPVEVNGILVGGITFQHHPEYKNVLADYLSHQRDIPSGRFVKVTPAGGYSPGIAFVASRERVGPDFLKVPKWCWAMRRLRLGYFV